MRYARYLIRLDDACPTMRAERWCELEQLFDELGIQPIVGVIPDNHDQKIIFDSANPDFWLNMQRWKSKGWELVLHGLHHVYHPIPLAGKPILSLSAKSEFVGLSLEHQIRMLRKGYSIMTEAGIKPRAFMAPSHSFDLVTLQALKEATDIRIITDGHSLHPYFAEGFTWLPQQLWRYREMPLGTWCICLHPNTMSRNEFQRLSTDLRRNSHKFINFDAALNLARPRSLTDRGFAALFQAALSIKSLRSYGAV